MASAGFVEDMVKLITLTHVDVNISHVYNRSVAVSHHNSPALATKGSLTHTITGVSTQLAPSHTDRISDIGLYQAKFRAGSAGAVVDMENAVVSLTQEVPFHWLMDPDVSSYQYSLVTGIRGSVGHNIAIVLSQVPDVTSPVLHVPVKSFQ
jgi:hypothetical protein